MDSRTRRNLKNVIKDTVACAVLHNLAKDWNMPEFAGPNQVPDDVEAAQQEPGENLNHATAGTRRRNIIVTRHF